MEAELEAISDAVRIESAGLKLQVDNRIPLKDYYDLATELLHQASIHRDNKTVVELYIMLLRFSSLMLETVPHHRDYTVKHPKQRHDLTKRAQSAKEEIKSLKPEIKCIAEDLNPGVLPNDRKIEQIIFPTDPEDHLCPKQVLTKIDMDEPPISGTPSGKLDDGLDEIVTSDHGKTDRQPSEGCCQLPLPSQLDSDLYLEKIPVTNCTVASTGELVSNDGPSMEENDKNFPDLSEDIPVDHKYCAQLQPLVADITSLIQEIFGLMCSSQESEKDAKEATRRAKRLERLYKKEVRRQNKTEEVLMDLVLKLENLKYQRDELLDELQIVQEEKGKSEAMIANLEDKLKTSQYLVDLLLKERDDAKQEVKVLRLKMPLMSSEMTSNILNFSVFELEQATLNFNDAWKIGEGRFTSVYRGFVRHTSVAIKRFDETSFEGQSKFHQEIELLGRVRHPYFVSIMGACPEASSLVYELLPNRSLEDCLTVKENSPPLPWPARIRIVTEVCSSLIFLHSSNPVMIHGNLKPSNILLDANFTSKLCDLRTTHFIGFNSAGTSLDYSKEVLAYMDPEFSDTFKLTACSDVYSFGVIILRLLTALPVSRVVEEVANALNEGELQYILDESAGEWPFIQASQLAHLGLRCCERIPSNRPNLEGEVWRMLDPLMRTSSLGSLLFSPQLQADNVPCYFMCPILQEVMREPHVASDGFTYEAEAIQAWFDSGHDTSPMTNMKLPNKDLLPNRALRSVIQEWMQKHGWQL